MALCVKEANKKILEMENDNINKNPEWVKAGKTISQLIKELQSFENQDLEVKISLDDGETFKCISLVTKEHNNEKSFCGLTNSE